MKKYQFGRQKINIVLLVFLTIVVPATATRASSMICNVGNDRILFQIRGSVMHSLGIEKQETVKINRATITSSGEIDMFYSIKIGGSGNVIEAEFPPSSPFGISAKKVSNIFAISTFFRENKRVLFVENVDFADHTYEAIGDRGSEGKKNCTSPVSLQ